MAPRPPYATDQPDSYYDSAQPPQRRQKEPAPVDPNSRTSAYDVYDSYFGNDPASNNRQSGIDALGLGFMNGSMDDDDEEEEEEDAHQGNTRQAEALPDKHAALAVATRQDSLSPPPPQYIAAPKPGYAAPIATLNMARPPQSAAPNGRQQDHQALEINPRQMYSSPSPVASTPHPLEAPPSPIVPAFARPRPPKAAEVTFATSEKAAIIRGDSEDLLLPKRGDAGDDFWRRFSMIAKEDRSTNHKESAWLRKTKSGSNKLAVWVWIVGLILILAGAGGIGLGWYLTHNVTSEAPTAIGGSADQASIYSTSASASVKSASATASVKTSLHVSPTNTLNDRALDARETTIPLRHRSAYRRR